MRFEALKDKPVVSIEGGTELGRVHDLLLDRSYLQIAALVVGGGGLGGLFGGRKQVVGYRAVRNAGPDAVMVQGSEAVEEVGDDSPYAGLPNLGDLNQEVMSEQGVHLGRVEDAEFDPQSGALTHLWFAPEGARRGPNQDIFQVARDHILSLGAKMAVVRQGPGESTAPAGDATTHLQPQ